MTCSLTVTRYSNHYICSGTSSWTIYHSAFSCLVMPPPFLFQSYPLSHSLRPLDLFSVHDFSCSVTCYPSLGFDLTWYSSRGLSLGFTLGFSLVQAYASILTRCDPWGTDRQAEHPTDWWYVLSDFPNSFERSYWPSFLIFGLRTRQDFWMLSVILSLLCPLKFSALCSINIPLLDSLFLIGHFLIIVFGSVLH